MRQLKTFLTKNFFLVTLFLITLVVLAVNIRINVFKYNNFDYGKFDLGNMTQMVWNVTQGRGLYLTDYFGTNLTRWGMSHVDPILYIFVPLFVVFPSPLTLVISQLVLVLASVFIIFKLAELHLNNKLVAFLLGLSYLFNPSVGYLTATTGFHGVTAVIPFFFGAFYVFEYMYKKDKYSIRNFIIFWVLLILTMMGKEQIPLYTFLYSLFILAFRNNKETFRHGVLLSVVSIVWFVWAFFIVIPAHADERVEGYQRFLESMNLDDSNLRDVALPNYFLNRYDGFGESYGEVARNIVLNPNKAILVFFGGDKPENFRRTFEPLAFLPFAYPAIAFMAAPDFLINYLTTAGGIGTSEIMNHRVSMILPVLFIATIYAIGYIRRNILKFKNAKVFLAFLVVIFAFYTSHVYNNPVYLWINSAVEKRIISKVFAKTDKDVIKKDLEIGDVVRISELEDKDRECALKIVNIIPDGASVSGPDSLGAHLSMRETYAIFPALYKEADYVIVDVFARKLLTILDSDVELIRDIVGSIMKNPDYDLKMGCGNYFVFEKVGPHNKSQLMPMQVRMKYDETVNLEFFQKVNIVDYEIAPEIQRGVLGDLKVVYYRAGDGSEKESSLEQYIMFTSLVNKKTGETYQMANLPAFALYQPEEWVKNRYYIENIPYVVPQHVESGDYMLFVGMGNKIRTRSMYLGEVKVL